MLSFSKNATESSLVRCAPLQPSSPLARGTCLTDSDMPHLFVLPALCGSKGAREMYSLQSVSLFLPWRQGTGPDVVSPPALSSPAPGKPDDDLIPRLARLEKIISLQFPQYNHSSALPDHPVPSAVHEMLNAVRVSLGVGGGSEGTEEDDEMREEDKDRGRGRLTKGKWFGVVRASSLLAGTPWACLLIREWVGQTERRSVHVRGTSPRQGPFSSLSAVFELFTDQLAFAFHSFNRRPRRWTCCRPSTRRSSCSWRTRRRQVSPFPTNLSAPLAFPHATLTLLRSTICSRKPPATHHRVRSFSHQGRRARPGAAAKGLCQHPRRLVFRQNQQLEVPNSRGHVPR